MNFIICCVFALGFFDITLTAARLDAKSLGMPCNIDDVECLKKSVDLFLKQTRNGVPAHGLLAMDPLSIPSLDVASDDNSRLYLNRNITVTGLGDKKLRDFKMDLKTGSVVFTTAADLNVNADTTLVVSNNSVKVPGHFWSHGSVLGTVRYSYTLKTDDKGVEHFVIGPETITCEPVDNPAVVLSLQLAELCNDKSCPEEMKQLNKKNFCKIVEKAYATAVDNIRAAAKVLPSTAVFKNLHKN